MRDAEKKQIVEYREMGLSYTQISKKMDLSIECIRTYCRRHGLGGALGFNGETDEEVVRCATCGRIVPQMPGRKQKRFCSDKCRMAWWNSHPELVDRKANYEFVCEYCKKKFVAYGNKNRKYCCHDCYIEDRFGGSRRW